MSVFIVRHAKAGSRDKWKGPDDLRPLSKKGKRQAEGLVELLSRRDINRVLSSPSVRCVQTVEPLAKALGLTVEEDAALAEGVAARDVVKLLHQVDDGTVVCTHGDVIPTMLETLRAEDGLQIASEYPCAKGSTWVLERDGGRYAEAQYLPSP